MQCSNQCARGSRKPQATLDRWQEADGCECSTAQQPAPRRRWTWRWRTAGSKATEPGCSVHGSINCSCRGTPNNQANSVESDVRHHAWCLAWHVQNTVCLGGGDGGLGGGGGLQGRQGVAQTAEPTVTSIASDDRGAEAAQEFNGQYHERASGQAGVMSSVLFQDTQCTKCKSARGTVPQP